jgi:uncharacterized protein
MAVVDAEGRSELHYAALANDVAAVEESFATGDDPEAPDRQGFTPLHFAAQEGALEAACKLLDRGAAVDPQNAFGNTPLFVAVTNYRGDGSMIDLLRQRGADAFRANKSGQTPVGLARLIANYDVARLFADLP